MIGKMEKNSMIEEKYVSFETAKLLKEKGFDAKCRYVYMSGGTRVPSQIFMEGESSVNKNDIELVTKYENWTEGDYAYLCPTLQMALAWMETQNYFIFPYPSYDGKFIKWAYGVWSDDSYMYLGHILEYDSEDVFETREEAEEAAIKYCLEKWV